MQRPTPDSRPSFLWDHDITCAEVQAILDEQDHPDRPMMLARLLREARPDEVWLWVSPQDVAEALPEISWRLGRKREFWPWLIDGWRQLGLLH